MRSFAQEVEILNLEDFGKASPTKKKAMTVRSTMPCKTIARWALKSDDSPSQKGRETSATKSPATPDVDKKKTEDSKKVPEDTAEREEKNLSQ